MFWLVMIQQTANAIKILLNGLRQQFQLKAGKPSITASFQALISVMVPFGIGIWGMATIRYCWRNIA